MAQLPAHIVTISLPRIRSLSSSWAGDRRLHARKRPCAFRRQRSARDQRLLRAAEDVPAPV